MAEWCSRLGSYVNAPAETHSHHAGVVCTCGGNCWAALRLAQPTLLGQPYDSLLWSVPYSLKTSVIIVSYNNFSTTTGPCLDRLKKLPKKDWEIIVVDNNSQDGSREQLYQYANINGDIRVKFNKQNEGFAKGNNDGVRLATGDIVILLNSDTIPLPHAMEKLSQKLIENEDWCMVGPMTNEAGNEQKIYTSTQSPENIIEEGKTWTENAEKSYIQTDSLVFFCVAMRRSFYEKLGGLDEDYGIGFYEDTDFCLKASQTGKKMVISEDIFVFHHGSASFSMNKAAIKKLLRKNKKIFIRKNNILPEIKHPREKILAVMHSYTQERDNIEAIEYRFNNRLRLALDLMPQNYIKRFFYMRKLGIVKKELAMARNNILSN